MREIKFRVWDKSHKEMTYGEWNIVFNSKLATRPPITIHGFDRDNEEEWDFVIQQFTGLLDKNGKEIYEGDIIKYQWEKYEHDIENDVGEVYFEDGMFLFDKKHEWATNDCNFLTNSIEVIGNIVENPELCETKKLDKQG